MKKYERPVVMINEELAEGIYAASGCYIFTSRITQKPEGQRDWYVIQVDGTHMAVDGHHSSDRTLRITFNQNVTYKDSEAYTCEGSGTTALTLRYIQDSEHPYHNNSNGNIGLGNLEVYSDAGLSIIKTEFVYCCMSCIDGHKPDGQ